MLKKNPQVMKTMKCSLKYRSPNSLYKLLLLQTNCITLIINY